MKNATILLLAAAFVIIIYGFQTYKLNPEDPPGKKIFIDSKCATCHSVEAAGITVKKQKKNVPDLSDSGTKHDASFIKKWIMKEETLNGAKHMFSYKGSDEDLDTMVAWLMSLSKPETGDSNKVDVMDSTTVQDSIELKLKDEK